MDSELDPERSFNIDLDPKKTLDYALFKRAASWFMNPSESHESMARLIANLLHEREPDEDKTLPPLKVILYKDLVPVAWSWDRLLPWMSGYVLFEDYFNYLEEYFRQNVGDDSSSLNLHAAATDCILAEKQLTTTIARHGGKAIGGPGLNDLSTKITNQASQIIDSVSGSGHTVPVQYAVPAACFLCITEEAKLMSSLADCIDSSVDKALANLCQEKFQFSEEVRQAALAILTTYKGPYFWRVAASLLGMKKEATIAFELRNIDVVYREEKMHMSEDIRTCLLELLNIILEYFPRESAVKYYPINRDYPALTSDHTGSHILEPDKQIRSADESVPVNSDKTIETPITPKSSAPGTPLSNSASSFSDDESVKDTKPNRKRKTIVQAQESETPSMQSSEPRKDVGIADLFGSQITSDGEPRYEIRSADAGYPTNSSATATPLSHSTSSASGIISGKDIEINKKRSSIGGTKDSGTPSTHSSEPRKVDGMTDQLGSQITSNGVAPPFTPIKDKFSGSVSSML